jgi:hypothetical protein
MQVKTCMDASRRMRERILSRARQLAILENDLVSVSRVTKVKWFFWRCKQSRNSV